MANFVNNNQNATNITFNQADVININTWNTDVNVEMMEKELNDLTETFPTHSDRIDMLREVIEELRNEKGNVKGKTFEKLGTAASLLSAIPLMQYAPDVIKFIHDVVPPEILVNIQL
ncbi:hypothetical protein [Halobacillus litoralis]|uniref:Uncharacterized protein n=1 Tax=Halobacillus litoralis TaxID=45668 RepID=A0A410MJ66_9BACI|nr:hypothetical protein [Halobacillus litoralis]QAS54772.1 hypothetical protein HLI_21175 [Halobacillus litoralis]